tara:strand:- start:4082 stop:5023 length:942 start_codon:yes stop_codon:yes gene_type:complete
MNLSLHDHACLHNELIWAYDHEPDPLQMDVNRTPGSGSWAWFLRSGKLKYTHKNRTTVVNPNHWILLPEGESRHTFSPDAHLLSIHFRSQWPNGENFFRLEEPAVLHRSSHPKLLENAGILVDFLQQKFPESQSHRSFHREESNYPDFLQVQIYFYAWLKEWIAIMIESAASSTYFRSNDERLLAACRILNESPLQQGLPTSDLKRISNLSHVHLNRLFLQELGISLSKYWEKRRLQKACDLLQVSEIPVKELAYSIGFRSDSLFVNWFRRRKGVSPGRFRAQMIRPTPDKGSKNPAARSDPHQRKIPTSPAE